MLFEDTNSEYMSRSVPDSEICHVKSAFLDTLANIFRKDIYVDICVTCADLYIRSKRYSIDTAPVILTLSQQEKFLGRF